MRPWWGGVETCTQQAGIDVGTSGLGEHCWAYTVVLITIGALNGIDEVVEDAGDIGVFSGR